MRRSTSRIGKLPREVLEQVNEKLYAGWEYPQLRRWLFEEVAGEDVPALGLAKGEKFSAVWLRAAKSAGNAGHFCELALGTWYRSRHPEWVRHKLLRSEPLRVVRRAAALTHVAGNRVASSKEAEPTPAPPGRGPDRTSRAGRPQAGTLAPPEQEDEESISVAGGDVIMRSVLIDAISSVEEGGKDRREVAALANAWARLNQGQVESEKLKLKTEDLRQAAFDEIGRDVRGNPEALALFKQLREVMEKEKEAKGK